MAEGKSKAERVGRWRSLIAYEAELVAEMPHLAEDLAALRRMDGEARRLFGEIAGLESDLRTAVRQLREMTREGDLLRTRVAAAVRGRLGFDAPMLLKYGLEPRAPRGGFRHQKPRVRKRSRSGGGTPPSGSLAAGG
jgi:hypothetical protein